MRKFAVAISAQKDEMGKTTSNVRSYVIDAVSHAEALGLAVMRRNKENDWCISNYAVTEIISEAEELEREIG